MDIKKVLIWLNIGCLLLLWLISATAYDGLPERIPVHFGFSGQPDAWAPKSFQTFFLLPLVNTLLIVLLVWIRSYPRLYNFPQKTEVKSWPEEKRQPVYDFLGIMTLAIALVVNIVFFVIQTMIIEAAKTAYLPPSRMWLILGVVLTLVPLMIYMMAKVNKIVQAIKKTLPDGQNR